MKSIILSIFILLASYCFGQKVKRKVANFGGTENTSVSQFIKEYDTLGRNTKEILTSNEDTLIYYFEKTFFYDEGNKLKYSIDKHSGGFINTTYFYYRNNFLYKSLTYNSTPKLISYKLFEANQWTEYIWGSNSKATRVQTLVFDSLGNDIRFYGWELFGDGRNTKWDYEFVNEYDNNKKLIKVDTYKSRNELEGTKTLEYNSIGLVTKEMRTLGNGKSYIDRRYRYDYY